MPEQYQFSCTDVHLQDAAKKRKLGKPLAPSLKHCVIELSDPFCELKTVGPDNMQVLDEVGNEASHSPHVVCSGSSKKYSLYSQSVVGGMHHHMNLHHLPWFVDPVHVCWTCHHMFPQKSKLKAHLWQHPEGSFVKNAATWVPVLQQFVQVLAEYWQEKDAAGLLTIKCSPLASE